MTVTLTYLGNLLGSLTYLGQCRPCGSQFMSTREMVARVNGETLCERCARKAAM